MVRAALLLAVSLPALAHAGLTVVDDAGSKLTFARYPQRIVSIAPGATEMLFSVGAGNRIVATVEFADEPAAARRIPRIGDANAIDLERLLTLQPDVVLVWPGGNNPAQITRIERLGLPLYRQRVARLKDIPASLRRLGELTGTQATAQSAARAFAVRLAALEQRYGNPASSVSVLLEIWNRPIYTVGGAHLLSDALRLCGARNVFADLPDLGPVVDIEAVIARNPDMIVAVAMPGKAAGWLQEWKKFGSLKAVKTGRLIPFEDTRFSRLGPSALDATERLCKAIHTARVTVATSARSHPP